MQRKATTGRGDNNVLEFGERVYADLAGPFRLKKNGKEMAAIDNSKYYLVIREARSNDYYSLRRFKERMMHHKRAKEFIALLETTAVVD